MQGMGYAWKMAIVVAMKGMRASSARRNAKAAWRIRARTSDDASQTALASVLEVIRANRARSSATVALLLHVVTMGAVRSMEAVRASRPTAAASANSSVQVVRAISVPRMASAMRRLGVSVVRDFAAISAKSHALVRSR